MRRLLFHGAHSYAAVKSIINSVDGHGFRPLLSGSKVGAIWGDGSYFARPNPPPPHPLPRHNKRHLTGLYRTSIL